MHPGAGWVPPRLDKLDVDLDIAAGRGLEEAVAHSAQLAPLTAGCITAAVAYVREPVAPHVNGRLCACPGAM
jgi:hypothetical protein